MATGGLDLLLDLDFQPEVPPPSTVWGQGLLVPALPAKALSDPLKVRSPPGSGQRKVLSALFSVGLSLPVRQLPRDQGSWDGHSVYCFMLPGARGLASCPPSLAPVQEEHLWKMSCRHRGRCCSATPEHRYSQCCPALATGPRPALAVPAPGVSSARSSSFPPFSVELEELAPRASGGWETFANSPWYTFCPSAGSPRQPCARWGFGVHGADGGPRSKDL